MVISRRFARKGSRQAFATIQNHQLFNVFLSQPYPNNQYPVDTQTNPISQNLLQYFPLPNTDPMCLPRPKWCARTRTRAG